MDKTIKFEKKALDEGRMCCIVLAETAVFFECLLLSHECDEAADDIVVAVVTGLLFLLMFDYHFVIQAQGWKDQQDIHDVIENDQQPTEDGKHPNGWDGTNRGGKERNGRRRGGQKHCGGSIGQSDRCYILRGSIGSISSSIFPFVGRNKNITCFFFLTTCMFIIFVFGDTTMYVK